MNRRVVGWLGVAVIAAGACASGRDLPLSPTDQEESPGGGLWEGLVQVSAADGRVRVKNQTQAVVGYFVVEKNTAIVAIFPPCTTNCRTLPQGAEVAVSYDDIVGYTPDAREAIVYWWTYGPKGRAEGGMSSVLVRL